MSKKLNFDEDSVGLEVHMQTEVGSKKAVSNENKKRQKKERPQKTVANFQEDGDAISFEVEGQSMEFPDEASITEDGELDNANDSETDHSDDDEIVLSQNNNATRKRDIEARLGTSRQSYNSPGELTILPRDTGKEQQEEEAGMQ